MFDMEAIDPEVEQFPISEPVDQIIDDPEPEEDEDDSSLDEDEDEDEDDDSSDEDSLDEV